MEANQVQPVPSSNTGVATCMIVPEVLKEDNYERWSIFMQHFLVAQDLWDVVLSSEMPDRVEDPRDWLKKNALALHAIKISCGTEIFDRIKKTNSAKDAWNTLADLHKQPNEDASRGSETDTEVKEIWTRILDNNERTKIVSSLYDENWDALKNLDRITQIFFPGGFTVLHIATIDGRLKIVKELVKIVGEDYLEIQDDNGDTALSLAACRGEVKIAECLVQKNEKSLTISNNEGYIPLVVACMNRQKDMASYLYSISTQFEFLLPGNSNQGALFLKYCALNFMLDVGLDLFLRCPRLAAGRESITFSEFSVQPSLFLSGAYLVPPFQCLFYSCLYVGGLPSPSDSAGSTRQLAWFKVMDRILRLFFFPFPGIGKLRRIYNLKLTHTYANLILRHRCKEISTYRDATQLVESRAIPAIFQAIKNGTWEIVVAILNANPDLILCNETLSRDIIFSAIKYRQRRILEFGYGLDARKNAVLSLRDKDGNNILHLAAKLPDFPSHEDVYSPPEWTLVQEEKWFEWMKSHLPYWCHQAKNHYGETPDQVFYREHRQLIKEMEDWGKKTAESYSIAAVLIVTIMFAALFTVPGGNDEKTGMPTLLRTKLFSWFLICDAASFLYASTSLMGFLSILTSSYDRRLLRRGMPFQILSSISTLIISIATMILAFIFALTIMSENKWQVLPAMIIYLLGVSYFIFFSWQVPVLLYLLRMTRFLTE